MIPGDSRNKMFGFLIPLVLIAATSWAPTTGRVIHKRAAFYIANETMCIVDGEVYRNGDPVPTDDHCERCTCRPPGFSCVLRDCDTKPGCKALRREGECCPEYVCGCLHNHRVYGDGEVIRDLQNACYTCRCHGSSISCTFADCFFRSDCHPEYVPGECCPRYDHCPPLSTTASSTVFTTQSTTQRPVIQQEEIAFVNLTTQHLEKFTSDGTTVTVTDIVPSTIRVTTPAGEEDQEAVTYTVGFDLTGGKISSILDLETSSLTTLIPTSTVSYTETTRHVSAHAETGKLTTLLETSTLPTHSSEFASTENGDIHPFSTDGDVLSTTQNEIVMTIVEESTTGSSIEENDVSTKLDFISSDPFSTIETSPSTDLHPSSEIDVDASVSMQASTSKDEFSSISILLDVTSEEQSPDNVSSLQPLFTTIYDAETASTPTEEKNASTTDLAYDTVFETSTIGPIITENLFSEITEQELTLNATVVDSSVEDASENSSEPNYSEINVTFDTTHSQHLTSDDEKVSTVSFEATTSADNESVHDYASNTTLLEPTHTEKSNITVPFDVTEEIFYDKNETESANVSFNYTETASHDMSTNFGEETTKSTTIEILSSESASKFTLPSEHENQSTVTVTDEEIAQSEFINNSTEVLETTTLTPSQNEENVTHFESTDESHISTSEREFNPLESNDTLDFAHISTTIASLTSDVTKKYSDKFSEISSTLSAVSADSVSDMDNVTLAPNYIDNEEENIPKHDTDITDDVISSTETSESPSSTDTFATEYLTVLSNFTDENFNTNTPEEIQEAEAFQTQSSTLKNYFNHTFDFDIITDNSQYQNVTSSNDSITASSNVTILPEKDTEDVTEHSEESHEEISSDDLTASPEVVSEIVLIVTENESSERVTGDISDDEGPNNDSFITTISDGASEQNSFITTISDSATEEDSSKSSEFVSTSFTDSNTLFSLSSTENSIANSGKHDVFYPIFEDNQITFSQTSYSPELEYDSSTFFNDKTVTTNGETEENYTVNLNKLTTDDGENVSYENHTTSDQFQTENASTETGLDYSEIITEEIQHHADEDTAESVVQDENLIINEDENQQILTSESEHADESSVGIPSDLPIDEHEDVLDSEENNPPNHLYNEKSTTSLVPNDLEELEFGEADLDSEGQSTTSVVDENYSSSKGSDFSEENISTTLFSIESVSTADPEEISVAENIPITVNSDQEIDYKNENLGDIEDKTEQVFDVKEDDNVSTLGELLTTEFITPEKDDGDDVSLQTTSNDDLIIKDDDINKVVDQNEIISLSNHIGNHTIEVLEDKQDDKNVSVIDNNSNEDENQVDLHTDDNTFSVQSFSSENDSDETLFAEHNATDANQDDDESLMLEGESLFNENEEEIPDSIREYVPDAAMFTGNGVLSTITSTSTENLNNTESVSHAVGLDEINIPTDETSKETDSEVLELITSTPRSDSSSTIRINILFGQDSFQDTINSDVSTSLNPNLDETSEISYHDRETTDFPTTHSSNSGVEFGAENQNGYTDTEKIIDSLIKSHTEIDTVTENSPLNINEHFKNTSFISGAEIDLTISEEPELNNENSNIFHDDNSLNIDAVSSNEQYNSSDAGISENSFEVTNSSGNAVLESNEHAFSLQNGLNLNTDEINEDFSENTEPNSLNSNMTNNEFINSDNSKQNNLYEAFGYLGGVFITGNSKYSPNDTESNVTENKVEQDNTINYGEIIDENIENSSEESDLGNEDIIELDGEEQNETDVENSLNVDEISSEMVDVSHEETTGTNYKLTESSEVPWETDSLNSSDSDIVFNHKIDSFSPSEILTDTDIKLTTIEFEGVDNVTDLNVTLQEEPMASDVSEPDEEVSDSGTLSTFFGSNNTDGNLQNETYQEQFTSISNFSMNEDSEISRESHGMGGKAFENTFPKPLPLKARSEEENDEDSLADIEYVQDQRKPLKPIIYSTTLSTHFQVNVNSNTSSNGNQTEKSEIMNKNSSPLQSSIRQLNKSDLVPGVDIILPPDSVTFPPKEQSGKKLTHGIPFESKQLYPSRPSVPEARRIPGEGNAQPYSYFDVVSNVFKAPGYDSELHSQALGGQQSYQSRKASVVRVKRQTDVNKMAGVSGSLVFDSPYEIEVPATIQKENIGGHVIVPQFQTRKAGAVDQISQVTSSTFLVIDPDEEKSPHSPSQTMRTMRFRNPPFAPRKDFGLLPSSVKHRRR